MHERPQARLFRLAPEAITVAAHFEPRLGWRLTTRVRRGDEDWDEARVRSYSHLTTEELYDVVAADLAQALEL